MPAESTATGFSTKTCLPAATAAARCTGRKPGGVARMTRSTSDGDHLLVGVEAGEASLRRHLVLRGEAGILARRPSRAPPGTASTRSGNRSPIATSSTPSGAAQAVARGAGAAAAAADEPDPDGVGAGDAHAGGEHERGGRRRRGLHEGSPRDVSLVLMVVPHALVALRYDVLAVTALARAETRRTDRPTATIGSWETAGRAGSTNHPAPRAPPGRRARRGRGTIRRA